MFVAFSQENALLEPMFEIPGSNIKQVNITEDVIMGTKSAEYVEKSNDESGNQSKHTYQNSDDHQESSDNKERAVNN